MLFNEIPMRQDGDCVAITLPPKFMEQASTILGAPFKDGLVLELFVSKADIELALAHHPELPHDGLRTTLRQTSHGLTLRFPHDFAKEYRLTPGQMLVLDIFKDKAFIRFKPANQIKDGQFKDSA